MHLCILPRRKNFFFIFASCSTTLGELLSSSQTNATCWALNQINTRFAISIQHFMFNKCEYVEFSYVFRVISYVGYYLRGKCWRLKLEFIKKKLQHNPFCENLEEFLQLDKVCRLTWVYWKFMGNLCQNWRTLSYVFISL